MKRYISIFLTLVLVLAALVTPVAAAETNEQFLNVLDYATLNNQGSNFITITGGSGSFSYVLPFSARFYYVDMVIQVTGLSTPISATVSVTTQTYTMSLSPLGNGIYRLTGNCTGMIHTTLNFVINASSTSVMYVSILSLEVGTVGSYSFPEVAGLWVTPGSTSSVSYMESASTSVNLKFEQYPNDDYVQMFMDYYGYVYLLNYKKYDYVDVHFSVTATTINSIDVYIGDQYVPFEISFLNGVPPGYDEDVGVEGDLDTTRPVSSLYHVSVRVDTSAIDKSLTSGLMVRIVGQYDNTSASCGVTVSGYTGYLYTQNLDPDTFFLRNIWNSIKSGFSSVGSWITAQTNSLTSAVSTNFSNLNSWIDSQTSTIISTLNSKFTSLKSWIEIQTSTLEAAIRGDASAGDEFNNELQEQADDLAEVGAVMDSVERPDIDSVDVSLNSYIDPSVLSVSTEGLTAVMSNDIILSVLMMSITLAIAGYVLYGKR